MAIDAALIDHQIGRGIMQKVFVGPIFNVFFVGNDAAVVVFVQIRPGPALKFAQRTLGPVRERIKTVQFNFYFGRIPEPRSHVHTESGRER